MGYIEETGAAQHLRDARITTDLRRHHRHPGQRPDRAQAGARRRRGDEAADRRHARRRRLGSVRPPQPARAAVVVFGNALRDLTEATDWLLAAPAREAAAGAVPYLMLCGTVIGGWLMARAAAAGSGERRRCRLHGRQAHHGAALRAARAARIRRTARRSRARRGHHIGFERCAILNTRLVVGRARASSSRSAWRVAAAARQVRQAPVACAGKAACLRWRRRRRQHRRRAAGRPLRHGEDGLQAAARGGVQRTPHRPVRRG